MAKQGFRPIVIPTDVTVSRLGNELKLTGPKGSLAIAIPADLEISSQNNLVSVKLKSATKQTLSLQGLVRSLIVSSVKGVTEGFERKLELKGTGYRAEVKTDELVLAVGFSHPVSLKIPEGITVSVERNTTVVLQGIDKHRLGQFAANIRAVRPPEPYKGKGIKYAEEVIKRKPGKAAKAATAA